MVEYSNEIGVSVERSIGGERIVRCFGQTTKTLKVVALRISHLASGLRIAGLLESKLKHS